MPRDPVRKLERQREYYHAHIERERANSRRRVQEYRFRKYGITLDAAHAMYNAQEHACAACRTPAEFSDLKVSKDRQGQVRGFVCHHCHTAITAINADAGRAHSLARFLSQ